MFKSFCLLSTLILLGACSHNQSKNVSKPYYVSKSFLDLIKTKKPTKPEADKRFPASENTIPGLQEFLLAVKANPSFLKAPVGYEVIKENSGEYDGQAFKSQDKLVYVKQNIDGHFVLESSNSGPVQFRLYDNDRLEEIENDIEAQKIIQSFKKISSTKFVMNLLIPWGQSEGSCEFELDLTKSNELQDISCKDNSGKNISESKIISVKPIKTEDYVSSLKSIKMEVFSSALNCDMSTTQVGEVQTCFDSVKDEEKRDWSYLIK